MSSPALFAPVAFLIGFPLLWLSISLLLSRVSGWSSLASYYGRDTEPKGERYGSQSMGLGRRFLMTSYGNCVIFHISETHLYLQPMILFRLGHKMLEIPLDHIEATPQRVLFFDVMNMKIRKRPNIKARVFGKFGDKLYKITNTI